MTRKITPLHKEKGYLIISNILSTEFGRVKGLNHKAIIETYRSHDLRQSIKDYKIITNINHTT